MNTATAAQTYVIASPFGRTLKRIRAALAELELCVVGEFDPSELLAEKTESRCRIVLVDCPFLALEATALDRGAAVLIPLHLVVWGGGERTHVLVAHPGTLFHFRLPAGTVAPLDRLQGRVAMALESLAEPAG
jgi:uncharacterized protein (DUF302 family)